MSAVCRLRAIVFGSCRCRYCNFVREVDGYLEDARLQEAAAKISAYFGAYR